jgi:hypothetical protein
MDRNADGLGKTETLGEDLRARVSHTTEPVKQEIKQAVEGTVGWIKGNPGLSVGLATLAGVAVGAVIVRLMTPPQSKTEKNVRHWVHNAQGSWDELRQALSGVKSAIGRLSE